MNGAKLGCSIVGAGPDKPPFVSTRGDAMGSTGALYDKPLELFVDRFAVHALDFRGHGASAAMMAGWSCK